jgi:type IV secretory pathway VirB6-like protein
MGRTMFTETKATRSEKSSWARLRQLLARVTLCALLLLLTACEEPPTECYLPGDNGDVIRIDIDVQAQNQECYNKCYTNGYRILGSGRLACNEFGEACLQISTLKSQGKDLGCSEASDPQVCMFNCQLNPGTDKCATPEPEWVTATNYVKFRAGDVINFNVKGSIQTCEPNPIQTGITGKSGSNLSFLTYKYDGTAPVMRISPKDEVWVDTIALRPYEKAAIQVRGEWKSCNAADPACTHKEGDGLYYKLKDKGDDTRGHIGSAQVESRETWLESYQESPGVFKTRKVVQYYVINEAETNNTLQLRYYDADTEYAANSGGYEIDIYTTGCEVSEGKFLEIKTETKTIDSAGKTQTGGKTYKYEALPKPWILKEDQVSLSYRINDPDGNYGNNRGAYKVTVGMTRTVPVASEIIGWVLNPLMNTLYGTVCPVAPKLSCACPAGYMSADGVCLVDEVSLPRLNVGGDGISTQECKPACPCPEGSVNEDGSCAVTSVTYTGIVNGQSTSRTCEPSSGEYTKNLSCDVGERTGGVVSKIFANMSDKTKSVNFNDIAQAALVLYMTLYGIGFMLGSVHRTQYEFTIRMIKILVVIQLISDGAWKFFSVHFFNFFIDGMVDLSDMMAGNWSSMSQGGGSGRGFEFLDRTIGVFFLDVTWLKILALIFSGPMGILFAALIILSMLMFLVGMLKAILAFLMAVIALGLMISVSPVFLCCILFQSTRPMFDRWLAQLVAFFLIPVFIFTVLIIFNEIVRGMLWGIMNYGICWDCIWEVFIPFEEDCASKDDCVNITFCIFKGWVIPRAGLGDWEVVPVGLMIIIAFLLVCELVPKAVDLGDGMARQMAGQINMALKGASNAAWKMMGGAKLEAKVNNAPKLLVTTVARAGVGKAASIAKGTAKAGGKALGGGLLAGVGAAMTAGGKKGGLQQSLGKRLEAYGKKTAITGLRDNDLVKGVRKVGDKLGKADKYRKTHTGKEIAGKIGKGIGKGLLEIIGFAPLARGVKDLKKKKLHGGVDDKELDKLAARANYERKAGEGVETALRDRQDNARYSDIDKKIRDRYADPTEQKKEAQAKLKDWADKHTDFKDPEYKKLQDDVKKWEEKERRGDVGDADKYKKWDDIIKRGEGTASIKSPFQKGADDAKAKDGDY